MTFSKNQLGSLLSVIALVAVVGGSAWLSHHGGGLAYSDTDPAYNRAYWKQELGAKGPQQTYRDFLTLNAKAPMQRQHFAAHVMGELLDETLGADGVAVCDASFGFGCFHGFFGRAISEGGEDSIAKLDAACVKKFGPLGTGCQHGIGHGIMEYVGYDHIDKALALCKRTTQLAPLLGCTSGVFMEYHERLAGSGENVSPQSQQFDPKNPYDPCTKLSSNQSSCYYELGYWLPSALGSEAKAGDVCAGLSGDSRQFCYMGVGSVILPMKQYATADALAYCTRLSGSDVRSCRAGVSWALYSDPRYRDQAKSACAFGTPSEQEACSTLADLTQGRDGH